ncbi:MAG: DUF2103 domain-containing protein [Natronomonas sp.]
MECRRCGTPLERPGDYCLVCHTENAEIVVLELGRERATITSLYDGDVVSARTVTTTPEDDERWVPTELRNYAGRITEEVHRKRPEEVYATGDRETLAAVRAEIHQPLYRVTGEDPIEAVRRRRGEEPLEVVEASLSEKLGGSHSTLIGDRDGQKALSVVAEHPHVKKVIPGPIDAGGSGSRTGVRAKATRADDTGNVRLLIRDGSSVQENRIVTTAGNRKQGEVVRADLNEALTEADLHE